MATTTLNGALDTTFSSVTLNGDVDNSTTTITVNDSTGFPAPNFRIRVDSEIMLVTAVDSNDFTVTRGYEGTIATEHIDTTILCTLTDFDVVDASSFPSPKFRIKVESEIMLVMKVSGNTFTAARGDVGTNVVSHANGATVDYIVSTDIGPINTEAI